MLTLTRKLGEYIRIGDDIRIVVREVRGQQVRLGIEAPRHVAVHREEIYLRIRKAEAEEAEQNPPHLRMLEEST